MCTIDVLAPSVHREYRYDPKDATPQTFKLLANARALPYKE